MTRADVIKELEVPCDCFSYDHDRCYHPDFTIDRMADEIVRLRKMREADRRVIKAAVAWVASLGTESAQAVSQSREKLGSPEYYDASEALCAAVAAAELEVANDAG